MMGAGHFLFFVTPFLAENDHGQRWRKENTPFLPCFLSSFPCCCSILLQRTLSLSPSLAALARSVLKRRKKSGAWYETLKKCLLKELCFCWLASQAFLFRALAAWVRLRGGGQGVGGKKEKKEKEKKLLLGRRAIPGSHNIFYYYNKLLVWFFFFGWHRIGWTFSYSMQCEWMKI